MVDICRYNELVHGGYFMVYKATYNWGAPSCIFIGRILNLVVKGYFMSSTSLFIMVVGILWVPTCDNHQQWL